jgi:hypothetical protein
MTSLALTASPATTTDRRRPVLYPFLIGLYPVLYLYARNAHSVPARELLGPVAMVLTLMFACWGTVTLVLRDAHTAGLLAALAFIVFATVESTAGVVELVLSELSRFWVYREHRVWPAPVIAVEVALFAYLSYRLIRVAPRTARMLTWPLNVFALLLLVQPAIQAARVRAEAPVAEAPQAQKPAPLPRLAVQERTPDLYYIILDSFARADVLAATYGYDLEPFLTRLERRGFYVSRLSTANYCQTPLSLSSSLNADYLHPTPDDESWLPPAQTFFRNNAVISALRPMGYRFVTFATGFDFTDDRGVDVRLSPEPEYNGFHRLLLESTPVARWLPQIVARDPYTMTRARTEFLFDRLPEVARENGPKFIFAHVLSPHPPFVFGEHGEDVSPHDSRYYLSDGTAYHSVYRGSRESYIAQYRAQVTYLVGRVERVIDGILANSSGPPIILLQSDHGSGLGLDVSSFERTDLWERMSILNAYYFPGERREGLHQRITPVNSFRVVLNNEFGARLPLLPEENYYSSWAQPQKFTRVTDRVEAPKDVGRSRR